MTIKLDIKELEDKGYKSALDLCRDLLSNKEIDSKEPLEVYRDGVLSYTINSIEEGAKLKFKEEPYPRFVAYEGDEEKFKRLSKLKTRLKLSPLVTGAFK